jgi:hypothetical protein
MVVVTQAAAQSAELPSGGSGFGVAVRAMAVQ